MSKQALKIRQATLSDSVELARLRWDFSSDEMKAGIQSFDNFAKGFKGFLRNALENGNWTIWVVESEEKKKLIANIYVQLVPKVPRPGSFKKKFGYVTNVYVDPEIRGKGVGSKLLNTVIDWAHKQRLEFLILWPSETSTNFYERAGFVRNQEAMEFQFKEIV